MLETPHLKKFIDYLVANGETPATHETCLKTLRNYVDAQEKEEIVCLVSDLLDYTHFLEGVMVKLNSLVKR